MVDPQRFLGGGGLGSSYIAEAWVDFGYVGIIVVNFVFGILLSQLHKWFRQDGFKPVQRKILYCFHKKGIKGEIKVTSLTGALMDMLAYHNGDASGNKAIISMAQNFVGTNNINVIDGKGNFGSRLKGGENAASPRYIFTKLNELTPYIFKKEDQLK